VGEEGVGWLLEMREMSWGGVIVIVIIIVRSEGAGWWWCHGKVVVGERTYGGVYLVDIERR
jgi:hypothetical protein